MATPLAHPLARPLVRGSPALLRSLARQVLLAMPLVLALLALLAGSAPATAATLSGAELALRSAQVRDTERAFARTLADRDLAAFGRFVAPDAVFLDGKDAARGAAAVIESWRSLFQAPVAPFSWAPEQVEVLPSGRLAISTGPVLNGKGERSGTFYSVWRRERAGQWRIVLDHGCAQCQECKR